MNKLANTKLAFIRHERHGPQAGFITQNLEKNRLFHVCNIWGSEYAVNRIFDYSNIFMNREASLGQYPNAPSSVRLLSSLDDPDLAAVNGQEYSHDQHEPLDDILHIRIEPGTVVPDVTIVLKSFQSGLCW